MFNPEGVRRSEVPRIAIVAAGPDIVGGHSVQAALLVDAWRSDGVDVSWLAIDRPLPWGLRWIRRVPIARTLVNELLYAWALLALRRADIVHVFSASYWSFLLAPVPAMVLGRLFGKRVVLHYHSGEVADHLDRRGWLVHPWIRLAHVVVVCSAFQQRVFERHGHDARIIRNIVDLRDFRFRGRWPLAPRLLTNRNLEPYYGVDDVLRAFAIIRAERPDATLVVAGAGSEEPRLRLLAAALGLEGVRFIGRVRPEDMPALLDDRDILLNGSRVDNQPVSLIEAFAAGLLVVSTDVGAIPEMVDDGWNGLLVPINTPERIACAVLSVLDAPAAGAAMTERAALAARDFTWPAVRDAWRAAYGIATPAGLAHGPATRPAAPAPAKGARA